MEREKEIVIVRGFFLRLIVDTPLIALFSLTKYVHDARDGILYPFLQGWRGYVPGRLYSFVSFSSHCYSISSKGEDIFNFFGWRADEKINEIFRITPRTELRDFKISTILQNNGSGDEGMAKNVRENIIENLEKKI